MRRTPFALLLTAVLALLVPAAAQAAGGVLVMDGHGHVRNHQERWAARAAQEPTPPTTTPTTPTPPGSSPGNIRGSVPQVLHALRDSGAIDPATHDAWAAQWKQASSSARKLKGTRRKELAAVIANVTALAKAGQLTASRGPQAFLTLDRNRRWWTTGPLLSWGRRVGFTGSELVWQYYPGQGIQVQWLGTFGKANAAFSAHDDDRLLNLLHEALGLAAQRAGGLAFEYTFRFDGGRPPWVSSLAQGTGIQALSRAAVRTGDTTFFEGARSALGIFRTAPPQGIAVPTATGTHYLQYSFAPKLRILNGFVQSLNGLHDFAVLANDDEGRTLFSAGEAQLRAELPAYDTGAWSLYAIPGAESNLNYHELLRDFLKSLCSRLAADAKKGRGFADGAAYCGAADRYTTYLSQPPVVEVTDQAARAKKRGKLAFRVSKVSTVTVTLLRRGKVALRSTARYGRGPHTLSVTPRKAGPLDVRVRAVDLAGNAAEAQARLDVRPAPHKKKRG